MRPFRLSHESVPETDWAPTGSSFQIGMAEDMSESHRKPRWQVPAAVATAAVVAAGLAVVLLVLGVGPPGPAQASHGTVGIAVGNRWFCNSSFGAGVVHTATIHVGDSVRWGDAANPYPGCSTGWASLHTVSECTDGTFTNCTDPFGSSDVDPQNPINESGFKGSSSTYGPIAFPTAGTYYYYCQLHPGDMRGRVVVQALATPTPTPTVGAAAQPTPTPQATGTQEGSGSTPTPTPRAAAGVLPAAGGPPPPRGAGVACAAAIMGAAVTLLGVGAVAMGHHYGPSPAGGRRRRR